MINNFKKSRGMGQGTGRGRGMGRGMRQGGGMGRSRGPGRRSGTAGLMNPSLAPPDPSASNPGMPLQQQKPMSQEQETQLLQAQAQAIRARLAQIEQGESTALAAVVNSSICQGCGICAEVCPTASIFIDRFATVNQITCLACGSCVEACPEGAISLQQV
ncbi:MAG: 4Fe-4S binding protein [Deltaproteobacteria bacterium]|nr:4Fe-4S binding protein [Deltaproteobacteria bacterium]MBW2084678.1 4Fe-4S binding protein [Deltaproteobacteria bacterium]